MGQASTLKEAAQAVRDADALLIGAGAGMGVDSGLPDFRGKEGFWRAYPPFAKLGVSFSDMANPRWFADDPRLAWGFYGHRMHLYRDTVPHEGFSLLRRWAEQMKLGCFVFTSNIDGQFQRAGFEELQVAECHGTLHYLQCTSPCGRDIWSAEEVEVEVDEETFRAAPPLPRCPRCQALARPNVLMFGDFAWLSERIAAQERRLDDWMQQVKASSSRLVVIECGAGGAIPTVRMQCEAVTAQLGGTLIRINPRESSGPRGTLSLAMGAKEALSQIDALL